jgi:hypothetical protein
MKLDAVAIELDLVNPALANGHPVYGRRQCPFNEAGTMVLTPIAADFYAETP